MWAVARSVSSVLGLGGSLAAASVLVLLGACAAGPELQRFPHYGFELAVPAGWAVEASPDGADGALFLALGEAASGAEDTRPFVTCRPQRTGGVQWVMERLLMVSSLRERDAEFSTFEPYAAGGLQGYAFSLYRPGDDLHVDYVGFDHEGTAVVCTWGYRSPEQARMEASRATLREIRSAE